MRPERGNVRFSMPQYAVDAPGTVTWALLGRRHSEYPAMTRFRAKVHGA